MVKCWSVLEAQLRIQNDSYITEGNTFVIPGTTAPLFTFKQKNEEKRKNLEKQTPPTRPADDNPGWLCGFI
jgi:hypothetical protein